MVTKLVLVLKGHIQVEVMEAILVVLGNHKSKELKMRRKNMYTTLSKIYGFGLGLMFLVRLSIWFNLVLKST